MTLGPYFHDDENVQAMQDTARTIGLVNLLLTLALDQGDRTDPRLLDALEMLGAIRRDAEYWKVDAP